MWDPESRVQGPGLPAPARVLVAAEESWTAPIVLSPNGRSLQTKSLGLERIGGHGFVFQPSALTAIGHLARRFHSLTGAQSGSVPGFGPLPVVVTGDDLVGDQIHAVRCGQPIIVLDGSDIVAVDRPGSLFTGSIVMARVIVVARVVQMMLQLLFSVTSALAHGAHLLRRR